MHADKLARRATTKIEGIAGILRPVINLSFNIDRQLDCIDAMGVADSTVHNSAYVRVLFYILVTISQLSGERRAALRRER